ncbi:MAG: T9SS type A sorting domain-containing protein [Candidatus Latescibacteria bacterium]|nr:T9SS type A sorting domain-containing protein [Candidatus Latescibacterota bacterium]
MALPRLAPALTIALSIALSTGASLEAQIVFTDQAAAAGVDSHHQSNGGAFGDYDADGWPDLFVPLIERDHFPLLYRNQGDGTFADQSDLLEARPGALGGAFVDIDSDGDLDLYVIYANSPDQLFRNQDGLFTQVERDHTGPQAATGAAFADLDGDGAVDLLNTHRLSVGNQFFPRVGDGFTDQSAQVSPLRGGRDTFSATPFDYDNDGDLDLYISSLRHPNLLHRNDGGGRFRPLAPALGLDHPSSDIAALPADYDNDGDLDLYLLTVGAMDDNAYYRNDGNDGFREMAAELGLTGLTGTTGAATADFDNDGDLDLITSKLGPSQVHENRGGQGFVDISTTALPAALLSQSTITTGVAAADYDGDGDVDIFMGNALGTDNLLRNDGSEGHWLHINLQPSPNGQTALGARLHLETAAGTQLREYVITSEIGTLHGDLLHFGLGTEKTIDRLSITWPTGQRQVLTDIAIDQHLSLTHPQPERDLRLQALTPFLELAWAPTIPQAAVINSGRQTLSGAQLQLHVSRAGQTLYQHQVAVPQLAAGATARLSLPTWAPTQVGPHDFTFALLVDDDLAANNTWTRTHYLYPFEDVAPALGVDDKGDGWAAAFSDFDNDGDPDLYVSNGGSRGPGANSFYRNDGSAGFADITQSSGTGDLGNGTGLVFADFDGDGYQDLFIAKGGFDLEGQANRLFHNQGDGTFADISQTAGLDIQLSSYATAVGDYDQDGHLDLYISQLRGQFNELYRNQGNGTFINRGPTKNIVSSQRFGGSGATFADFDNDGDLDLYASIFGTTNLYYADGGDTSYTIRPAGAAGGESMGLTLGDYDNDDDLDFFVVNRNGRSVLYRNDLDTAQFTDVGTATGSENMAEGTGAAFGDFDNDGDLDLFMANWRVPNQVALNQGDGTFIDIAANIGLDDTTSSNSVLLADYDSDGDLDIYLVNERAPNRLYRNGGSANHWLQAKVQGRGHNLDGVGARLTAHFAGRTATRAVNDLDGFSQNNRVVHLGLGTTDRIDSLVLHWPSGQRDVHRALAADALVHLLEGGALTSVEALDSAPQTFFLRQNYPNPFNASTLIPFGIEHPGPVRLALYNALGQQIRRLIHGPRPAGPQHIIWDGRNDQGHAVASGLYFYRLTTAAQVQVKSLALIR